MTSRAPGENEEDFQPLLLFLAGDKIHDKSKSDTQFFLPHSYSHAEVKYEEVIFDSGVSKKKSVRLRSLPAPAAAVECW